MPARQNTPTGGLAPESRQIEAPLPARIQGVDQIWLINLDRRPDRLEGFMRRHPEMSGRINRFSAYDGKNLQLTPAFARLFLPNNFEWHKPTMGCAMSHLALWYKLASEAEENTSYLILEDDAMLEPSWVSAVEKAFYSGAVPPDWDIIYLGGILPKYRDHFENSIEPLNRSIARVKPDCVFGNNPPGYYHFCAYAYLLSKRGAERILDIVKRGNGVWMQADFLAAYTTPQLTPPRPIYFFNPLIAQSFQDTADGLVRPYDESGLPTDKVDSDIWKESDKFSAEEVSRCQAVDLPLDIPAALGWKQSESGEAWAAADKKKDAPAEPSPATQGSVVSNTTMGSGTVIPQNLGRMVLEGHLGGFFSEGDGGTYYPVMWSHLVRKYAIGSVLYVGCGRGYSTLYFQTLGCRIKGIEGSGEAAETNLIGKDFVLTDYTLGPAPIEESFDLAWSCEFVEHVEEKFMGNYLQDFCRARFLAMTFAGPGQPGHHHVNCRPAEYWIRVLHAHGFDYLPEDTAEMRELAKQDMEKNDRETNKRFVYHFIHRGLVFRRNALFQGCSVTSDTKSNSGS